MFYLQFLRKIDIPFRFYWYLKSKCLEKYQKCARHINALPVFCCFVIQAGVIALYCSAGFLLMCLFLTLYFGSINSIIPSISFGFTFDRIFNDSKCLSRLCVHVFNHPVFFYLSQPGLISIDLSQHNFISF